MFASLKVGVDARKGWTVMEVPNGWYEVLRGPRPPYVRWPAVSRGQPSQCCQSQPRLQSRPQSILRHIRPPTRATQFSDLPRCGIRQTL